MRIAIIDTFPIIRRGLVLFLNENLTGLDILESECIWEFSKSNPGLVPDVLVVSLSQKSFIANFDIIEFVKSSYDLRSVVFYDEETDFMRLREYFNIGVHNYVSKQSAPAELKKCILTVLGQQGLRNLKKAS
nr:hypothetical protein [uncultured Dyadobacter sp.]